MTTRYRLSHLKLPLNYTQHHLIQAVSRLIRRPPKAIESVRVIRESVDARGGRTPQFVVQLEFLTKQPLTQKLPPKVSKNDISFFACPTPRSLRPQKSVPGPAPPVIIVGAGPAGLFAALALVEAGRPVTLIERGKPVETRMKDIGLLRSQGTLDPESNVCFGEGGAGAYSDGKLTTRIKHPLKNWVLHQWVRFGAPSDILIKAYPHLGTDRLKKILQNLRRHLIEHGVEILFETKMIDLMVHRDSVIGVVLSNGQARPGHPVVLATGHSARDTVLQLHRLGVAMEPKPFAVGLRVEHPQELIDRSQWGKTAGHRRLGAAQYRLSCQVPEADGFRRGVYSFCMCPGGVIIPTPTQPEHMVVNGMSHSARATGFANAGLVVQVRPEDLRSHGFSDHPLMGMAFQQELEHATYSATQQPYGAPAMRVSDFVQRKATGNLAPTRFRPRAEPADLWEILPAWILEPLAQGLAHFDSVIPGFVSDAGNLMAVESRTSSPVRITRNDALMSTTLAGLMPVGEGAGYAGGIVSSAVDGVRAAEVILENG